MRCIMWLIHPLGNVIPLVFHTFRPESVKYNSNLSSHRTGIVVWQSWILFLSDFYDKLAKPITQFFVCLKQIQIYKLIAFVNTQRRTHCISFLRPFIQRSQTPRGIGLRLLRCFLLSSLLQILVTDRGNFTCARTSFCLDSIAFVFLLVLCLVKVIVNPLQKSGSKSLSSTSTSVRKQSCVI